MSKSDYRVIKEENASPIKAWVNGVPFEEEAERQLRNTAQLPFIHKWIAVMPDVHLGLGATIGSVIPTTQAIIPAAVGVDLGCGMMAVRTSLDGSQLPDNMEGVREAIEKEVPHGRSHHGGRNDRGAWGRLPPEVEKGWAGLEHGFNSIVSKYPKLANANSVHHLGTLGSGNHFIEVCQDQQDGIWFMLHSGSRGIGNRIGTSFISLAKQDMKNWFINLPDKDLAYLSEGTQHFKDYVEAVSWAQEFARINREIMMENVIAAVRKTSGIPPFEARVEAVNCHHNYVAREHHYGKDIWVTRKGAVRAGKGELGIIPGSMGARSYIVRGLGNPESFHSCSHGAGRVMSRREAKRRFTIADHKKATRGVACRKDKNVLDETPAAYKNIDKVMAAQKDLVEIVTTLKQIVCVKG